MHGAPKQVLRHARDREMEEKKLYSEPDPSAYPPKAHRRARRHDNKKNDNTAAGRTDDSSPCIIADRRYL